MKTLLLTHDLSCAIGNLGKAASRYYLLVAAIEFTIQLAIDEGGCDASEMRMLERELIAKIVSTA